MTVGNGLLITLDAFACFEVTDGVDSPQSTSHGAWKVYRACGSGWEWFTTVWIAEGADSESQQFAPDMPAAERKVQDILNSLNRRAA